jgi:hypothetical protein
VRPVDRHKSREVVAIVGLHDQMGHPPLERIDNDVRQFAVDPISAVDRVTQM